MKKTTPSWMRDRNALAMWIGKRRVVMSAVPREFNLSMVSQETLKAAVKTAIKRARRRQ
jgi:hypothetical protein